MQRFILRRLVLAIPTTILVSFMVFSLIRLIPGDVVLLLLETSPQLGYADDIARLRAKLGLDQPFHIQYVQWLGKMAQGDLGESLWTKRSTIEEITYRLPVTLQLGFMAIVLAMFFGVSFGVISALKQDSVIDYAVRIFSIIMLSIPGFWMATLIIVFPAIWFKYSPPLEFKPLFEDPLLNIQMMIIPATLLGLERSAGLMRLTRAMMLEVLRQDYIRTARAKGLSETLVIVRHALQNAMIPVVTVVGLSVPFLLGGSVIMEQIFALPGVGRLMIEVISKKDFPLLQSINLFFALIIIATNILVDLTYGMLDPRIRYS
ncbi:MAG: ABC transporter permease [Chloroflexi bacterium]|nr:ABC transporter permease [Chloroflexota bacterium]